MKGLGNYLCRRRRRWDELVRSEEAVRWPGTGRTLSSIRSWVEETETGDLGELAALREDDPVRGSPSPSSSETRIGPFVSALRRLASSRSRAAMRRARAS